MSAQDIFAAQFWSWPDPAVKRDASGRVLFVNAAFLQLFGGQAQDWHNNAIGGWPAPQGQGHAYRFESRLPGQPEIGDQTYDWIEMVMADGTAFALARNVTVFLQPTDPQPGQTMPAQNTSHLEEQSAPPPQAQPAPQAAPASMPMHAQEPEPAFAPPPASAPAMAETPETVQAHNADIPDLSAEAPMPPVAEEPRYEPPQSAAQKETETHLPAQIETAHAEPAPAEKEQEDAPRDFERRALPIETDSAVLGNNWRDAVIAKAVGAETPAEEEADMGTDIEIEAKPASAPRSEGSTGPIRILLAEDNAINALLTRTLLEAEGHTVETVEDGLLAVEAMKTSSYDLIFMDMRMPNMDGLEATRKIRALPNVSQDLPIIALTANAFDDDRNACFDSGMNDFMTKPVSAEELSEMVENWMSQSRKKMAS